MVRYILIISLLFILSCDDHLGSFPFLDYYCPIENLNVCLNDFNDYELTWEYNGDSNENCTGTAFKFLLYSSPISGDFPDQPIYLSVVPEYDNMPNKYYLDENNVYHYITETFDNIGEENYFTILVDYNLGNNEFSYDNPVSSLTLNVGGPSIDLNILGCDGENQYDDDCVSLNINHDALDCTNISETEIYRIVERENGEVLEDSLVAILNDNMPIQDQFHLELCDEENYVTIDGFSMNLEQSFCNEITPNQNYVLKYYYRNNGVYSDTSTYIEMIKFDRNPIEATSKALSSTASRLYIDQDANLTYYDHMLLYHYDGNPSLIDAPDFLINLDDSILNNSFFETNHVFDLESMIDGNYFVLLISDYTYKFFGELLNMETLDNILEGFLLIENLASNSLNDGDDYYMNKYEITSDANDFVNSQIQGDLPLQSNCEDAIIHIKNLSYSGLIFTLPTTEEWEYAAEYNIFTEETYLYPWGNEIDAYYANYLNSDIPSDSTGTVGVGLHNWPSPFGLYDMSGNVMEWTLDEYGNCLAKGGNYLSTGEDLLINTDHEQIPSSSSLGMGFRIIMKNLEN